MAIRTLFCLIITLVLVPSLTQAEVYKWVDEWGKTHFGDRPPDEGVAEKVKIKAPPTEAQRLEAQARADALAEIQFKRDHVKGTMARERRNDERKQQLADNQRSQKCLSAQRNLRILGMQRPIYYTNENGEEVYVSDNERELQKQQANREVDQYCS
ncbi:MAG: DUF4124 domain-containing protein [Gammaproteobacteria bacterium]|nr:DUF4124 domain-containing protein [Gammaproteobacteria bacterium]